MRVQPAAVIETSPRLFAALEAAFAVSFEAGAGESDDTGAVLLAGDGALLPSHEELTRPGRPTLAIGARRQAAATARRLTLGSCPPLDRRLHGISVRDPLDGPGIGAPGPAERVVAATGPDPAWTISGEEAPVHRVRSSLPELAPEQGLRDLFAEHALALVALVQFLRAVEGDESRPQPRLRAAFLFDDPNLRWRTYGFIDYQRLLEHADAHGYHAAMALIPLDARWQHRPTVELFRAHPDRLSLVLHGNNHVSRELMRADAAGAVPLAAQALRRAARFEARYGLAIDRVMTPPHGMCGPSVAGSLGPLGYDALCAIHPFPWAERPPAGQPLAGWEPAEFAAGCAVIPRMHLFTDPGEIAFRAFLGQPLVLYGHHEDLADGLDPLARIAARIDALGEVEWTSLGGIAAGNYSLALDGSVARVRPYAHRLRVEVPEGVESIVVESPRAGEGLAGWSLDRSAPLPFGSAASCQAGSAQVRLLPRASFDPERIPSPRPSAWPLLRRLATESRDRLAPLQAGLA